MFGPTCKGSAMTLLPAPSRGRLMQEWWEEGDGNYVAPELLKSNGSPSPAADIYSLGVTMYECATGKEEERFWRATATGRCAHVGCV